MPVDAGHTNAMDKHTVSCRPDRSPPSSGGAAVQEAAGCTPGPVGPGSDTAGHRPGCIGARSRLAVGTRRTAAHERQAMISSTSHAHADTVV
jgi:hypothetical protein